MARIAELKREDLSPRQQQLHDAFLRARPRKTLTGPFAVLIHAPDIAEPADRLVNYYRGKPKLGRRLLELIILLVVRDATAQYAWSVHEPHALEFGLILSLPRLLSVAIRLELGLRLRLLKPALPGQRLIAGN